MIPEPGYRERAALYATEIRGVDPPLLLGDLLAGLRAKREGVAEVPSGTGHFLRDYAAAGVSPTLIDAEPAMLEAALANVDASSHDPPSTVELRLGASGAGVRFAGVVSPNAAVNMLAADLGIDGVLAALAKLLKPGGRLLLQLLLVHDDGTVDAGTAYDPGAAHGQWLREWTRPAIGGRLTRSRRQRRDGRRLTIDFAREFEGIARPVDTVQLDLLTIPDLNRSLDSSGLRTERIILGGSRPSEILVSKKRMRDDDQRTDILAELS